MGGRPVTCCFTGHRPEKLPWGTNEEDPRCKLLKQKILDTLKTVYDDGMRHFICGMARGSDFYFAEAVLELRKQRQGVTLEAALPYPDQAEKWPREDRHRWRELLASCDMETVVQHQYTPGCMLRRNRYMVDHSAMVIAVYDGTDGGTRWTLEYALRQRIPFVDIRP